MSYRDNRNIAIKGLLLATRLKCDGMMAEVSEKIIIIRYLIEESVTFSPDFFSDKASMERELIWFECGHSGGYNKPNSMG